MIQIGMRCSPDWLCDGLSWAFGGLLLVLLAGLIYRIYRQWQQDQSKKKRR